MSENHIVLSEGDVFLTPEDKREGNYKLALRLLVRELRALNLESVKKVLDRFGCKEIEFGETIRLGITFPADIERYQWFKTEGYELRKVLPESKAPVKKNAKS